MKTFKQYLEEGVRVNTPFGTNEPQFDNRQVDTDGDYSYVTWWLAGGGLKYRGEFVYQHAGEEEEEYMDIEPFFTFDFYSDHSATRVPSRKYSETAQTFSGALSALHAFCKKHKPVFVMSEPSTDSHYKLYKKTSSNPQAQRLFKQIGYKLSYGEDPNGFQLGEFFIVERIR